MVSEREVDGLTAQSVRLSPTIELTYAIDGSTLVAATDPAAVEQLASGEGAWTKKSSSTGQPTAFPAIFPCSAIWTWRA